VRNGRFSRGRGKVTAAELEFRGLATEAQRIPRGRTMKRSIWNFCRFFSAGLVPRSGFDPKPSDPRLHESVTNAEQPKSIRAYS